MLAIVQLHVIVMDFHTNSESGVPLMFYILHTFYRHAKLLILLLALFQSWYITGSLSKIKKVSISDDNVR